MATLVKFETEQEETVGRIRVLVKKLKASKNSKYPTHKNSSETLSKNPNDRTGTLKGGPFWIFKHPLSQNIKKLKGRPFGEFFFEKVAQCRKN